MHTFIWKENDQRQRASNGKTEIHAWCCRHDTSLIISSVYWVSCPCLSHEFWDQKQCETTMIRPRSTLDKTQQYIIHFRCKSLITFIALYYYCRSNNLILRLILNECACLNFNFNHSIKAYNGKHMTYRVSLHSMEVLSSEAHKRQSQENAKSARGARVNERWSYPNFLEVSLP